MIHLFVHHTININNKIKSLKIHDDAIISVIHLIL